MTTRVRIGFMLIMALAVMGMASCDHYNCSSGANFSGSTCTAGTTSLGGGGGSSGSATAAFVFVADAAGTGTTGTIDGYTLNTSASTFAATSSYTAPATPLSDAGVGLAVAQKQYLYTGYPSTNQIYGWTISSSGALTAISGTPVSAPFMDSVLAGFGTQNVITNPAGTLLFFAATSQDKIYVYQIGSGGVLTAASGSPFSVPFFPQNMTTDGLGNYLYVTSYSTNHTGSQIAAYTIGSSGSLTAVQGSPFAYPMWQVQGDSSGNFLIGTSGNSAVQGFSGIDDDHLYVFSIATSGANAGAITPVTGSPFATTNSPQDIAVQSDSGGDLVYAFGIADSALAFNPAEGFALSSTGTLTAVNGSPFSLAAVGDIAQFDQSGAFLFVYGGIINPSTNEVTFQMGSFDVASGGTLTEPTTTLTLASGGYFAVTDPN